MKAAACRNARHASRPALTPVETQLPSACVSCPSRSMDAGHVCGKKMSPPFETRLDTRALGIGSSNMLRVMFLHVIGRLSSALRPRAVPAGRKRCTRSAAHNSCRRVMLTKLSGSVPFKRFPLKTLAKQPAHSKAHPTMPRADGARAARMTVLAHACDRVAARTSCQFGFGTGGDR